jgi:hypothetical protein
LTVSLISFCLPFFVSFFLHARHREIERGREGAAEEERLRGDGGDGGRRSTPGMERRRPGRQKKAAAGKED